MCLSCLFVHCTTLSYQLPFSRHFFSSLDPVISIFIRSPLFSHFSLSSTSHWHPLSSLSFPGPSLLSSLSPSLSLLPLIGPLSLFPILSWPPLFTHNPPLSLPLSLFYLSLTLSLSSLSFPDPLSSLITHLSILWGSHLSVLSVFSAVSSCYLLSLFCSLFYLSSLFSSRSLLSLLFSPILSYLSSFCSHYNVIK